MNYIDKREILSEFFQDKGYDLRKFQGFPDNSMVISKALNKEDALNVLDLYYELFIPVLGGDVLYLKQNGILDYTNDNWCIDRLHKETYSQFLKRSIDTSKDYIKNYRHPFLKESSILFNIVPFDIENYDTRVTQGDCEDTLSCTEIG